MCGREGAGGLGWIYEEGQGQAGAGLRWRHLGLLLGAQWRIPEEAEPMGQNHPEVAVWDRLGAPVTLVHSGSAQTGVGVGAE